MRSRHVLIFVASIPLAGTAMAGDGGMSYTYIQAGLLGGDLRNSGETTRGDGGALDTSFELGSHLLMRLDSSTIAYLDSNLGLRLETGSLGLGAHAPLGEKIDFTGGISLQHMASKLTGVAGSDSATGWGANIGLRGRIGEKFQWTTGVQYQDVGEFKSSVGFTVGAHYYLSPAFALGLRISGRKHDQDALDSSEWISSVDLRYHFRMD
jgi:hypothetical protein